MTSGIRDMLDKDILAVARLDADSFSSPWSIESFKSELSKENCIYARVANCNEVVGYSISWRVADELQVGKINTEVNLRRKGIGRQLLQDIVDHAVHRHLRIIFLEVRRSNEAAFQFYSRAGFEAAQVRKNYYSNPDEDALVLKKEL